jgi:hypothetical protein
MKVVYTEGKKIKNHEDSKKAMSPSQGQRLRRKQPCQHLILDFQPPKTLRR